MNNTFEIPVFVTGKETNEKFYTGKIDVPVSEMAYINFALNKLSFVLINEITVFKFRRYVNIFIEANDGLSWSEGPFDTDIIIGKITDENRKWKTMQFINHYIDKISDKLSDIYETMHISETRKDYIRKDIEELNNIGLIAAGKKSGKYSNTPKARLLKKLKKGD